MDGESPVYIPRAPDMPALLLYKARLKANYFMMQSISIDTIVDSEQLKAQANELFGKAKIDSCVCAVGGSLGSGIELARQNMRFSGALHSQLGYVELAVRNASDVQIRNLSLRECGTECWTAESSTPDLVYKLINKNIRDARRLAIEKYALRSQNRASIIPTHDDVLSNLMWGTWTKLIGKWSSGPETVYQQQLWQESLHLAFPNLGSDDASRSSISKKLFYLRGVRNREAHYDSLFTIAKDINKVINACYSILAAIDKGLTTGWLDPGLLRSHARTIRGLIDESHPSS